MGGAAGESRPARRWKIPLTLFLLATFIVAVNFFANWLTDQLQIEVGPRNEHFIHYIIIVSVLVYAVLIAIPFVPSVEIGLGLILVLGADLAPLVYLFTIVGLTLAFVAGRMIPESGIQKFFEELSLSRASELMKRLRPLSTDERLSLLVSHAPKRLVPTLIRHRYIAVAIALNIPGNTIIGGGGGIALVSGMSRLFRFWAFLLMLCVAVAPVPLTIVLFGTDIFS